MLRTGEVGSGLGMEWMSDAVNTKNSQFLCAQMMVVPF